MKRGHEVPMPIFPEADAVVQRADRECHSLEITPRLASRVARGARV